LIKANLKMLGRFSNCCKRPATFLLVPGVGHSGRIAWKSPRFGSKSPKKKSGDVVREIALAACTWLTLSVIKMIPW
jgi:hypothetical protein